MEEDHIYSDKTGKEGEEKGTSVYTPTLKEKEEVNSAKLTDLLTHRCEPAPRSETFYHTYRLSQLGMKRSQIGRMLEELMPSLTRASTEMDRDRYRSNLRGIVYALGAAGYACKWLALPMGDYHYRKDRRLGMLGLARRRVERILDLLDEAGLMIRGIRGYRLPDGTGIMSQFYPSPKLMHYFAACLYELEEDFDIPLYQYNKFPTGTQPEPEEVAGQVAVISRYNEFMKQFSWARKGPTHRTFTRSMQEGGRLINAFQNIVKNRVPIRPQTLLDGSPIVEPDFSANHLRMLAALSGEELPADPYSIVGKKAGASRDAVKAYTTAALGADSGQLAGAMKSLRINALAPVSTESFYEIRRTFETEFPWTVKSKAFFNGSGLSMQLHEGNIGMRIISRAAEDEIPVLAVHDSFAVRERDREWITAMMREAWKQELATDIEPVIN